MLDKIHLQFCRNILKIRTSTPNFISYGEIGRVPIDVVIINVRMISFWNKLLTYNQKLSSILYRIMYMLRDRPFNLKGGLWFFVSFRKIFQTTQELEYFFFCRTKHEFFFQYLH